MEDAILVDNRAEEITKQASSVFLWDALQNNDLSWMSIYMLEENKSCLLSIPGKHAHTFVLSVAVFKQVMSNMILSHTD